MAVCFAPHVIVLLLAKNNLIKLFIFIVYLHTGVALYPIGSAAAATIEAAYFTLLQISILMLVYLTVSFYSRSGIYPRDLTELRW